MRDYDNKLIGTLLLVILALVFYAALKHQAYMIKSLNTDGTCPTKLDEWPVRVCPPDPEGE